MFPDVELVSEKIITDEKGIYSSGGANSFWNLLIYLMRKVYRQGHGHPCIQVF